MLVPLESGKGILWMSKEINSQLYLRTGILQTHVDQVLVVVDALRTHRPEEEKQKGAERNHTDMGLSTQKLCHTLYKKSDHVRR